MRRIAGFFLPVFLFFCVAAFAADRDPLILAVHPYLASTELVDRFTPLADHLGRMLARPVTLAISSDYEEHIARVGRDLVDIAYMGPASYAAMTGTYGAKPILARLETNGTPTFRGIIIVREDSPLRTLADLRGKRLAFGDPDSTMSHLLPRHMLQQAGLTLDDLAGHAFLQNHQNVALGVLLGDFDAGAVKEEVFFEYQEQGLRALAQTPRISEHLFVASGTMAPELVAALRRHLLALGKTKNGLAILSGIQEGTTGLVPATDEDYQELRMILQSLKASGILGAE